MRPVIVRQSVRCVIRRPPFGRPDRRDVDQRLHSQICSDPSSTSRGRWPRPKPRLPRWPRRRGSTPAEDWVDGASMPSTSRSTTTVGHGGRPFAPRSAPSSWTGSPRPWDRRGGRELVAPCRDPETRMAPPTTAGPTKRSCTVIGCAPGRIRPTTVHQAASSRSPLTWRFWSRPAGVGWSIRSRADMAMLPAGGRMRPSEFVARLDRRVVPHHGFGLAGGRAGQGGEPAKLCLQWGELQRAGDGRPAAPRSRRPGGVV